MTEAETLIALANAIRRLDALRIATDRLEEIVRVQSIGEFILHEYEQEISDFVTKLIKENKGPFITEILKNAEDRVNHCRAQLETFRC